MEAEGGEGGVTDAPQKKHLSGVSPTLRHQGRTDWLPRDEIRAQGTTAATEQIERIWGVLEKRKKKKPAENSDGKTIKYLRHETSIVRFSRCLRFNN